MTDQHGRQRLFTSALCQGIFGDFSFFIFFKCRLIVCSSSPVLHKQVYFVALKPTSENMLPANQTFTHGAHHLRATPSSSQSHLWIPGYYVFSYGLKHGLFFLFFCIFVPDKTLLSTSLNWSRWAFPTSDRTDWKCQRPPFVLSNTKSQSCTRC